MEEGHLLLPSFTLVVCARINELRSAQTAHKTAFHLEVLQAEGEDNVLILTSDTSLLSPAISISSAVCRRLVEDYARKG